MAAAVLLTTSENLAGEVSREINQQIKTLSRKTIIEKSLDKYGAIIITQSVDEALDIANLFAPEHLELMVENPAKNFRESQKCRVRFSGFFYAGSIG